MSEYVPAALRREVRRLGEEVKFLIDSNVCPHCENGSVTPAEPKCDQCGFEVNPEHVAWG